MPSFDIPRFNGSFRSQNKKYVMKDQGTQFQGSSSKRGPNEEENPFKNLIEKISMFRSNYHDSSISNN